MHSHAHKTPPLLVAALYVSLLITAEAAGNEVAIIGATIHSGGQVSLLWAPSASPVPPPNATLSNDALSSLPPLNASAAWASLVTLHNVTVRNGSTVVVNLTSLFSAAASLGAPMQVVVDISNCSFTESSLLRIVGVEGGEPTEAMRVSIASNNSSSMPFITVRVSACMFVGGSGWQLGPTFGLPMATRVSIEDSVVTAQMPLDRVALGSGTAAGSPPWLVEVGGVDCSGVGTSIGLLRVAVSLTANFPALAPHYGASAMAFTGKNRIRDGARLVVRRSTISVSGAVRLYVDVFMPPPLQFSAVRWESHSSVWVINGSLVAFTQSLLSAALRVHWLSGIESGLRFGEGGGAASLLHGEGSAFLVADESVLIVDGSALEAFVATGEVLPYRSAAGWRWMADSVVSVSNGSIVTLSNSTVTVEALGTGAVVCTAIHMNRTTVTASNGSVSMAIGNSTLTVTATLAVSAPLFVVTNQVAAGGFVCLSCRFAQESNATGLRISDGTTVFTQSNFAASSSVAVTNSSVTVSGGSSAVSICSSLPGNAVSGCQLLAVLVVGGMQLTTEVLRNGAVRTRCTNVVVDDVSIHITGEYSTLLRMSDGVAASVRQVAVPSSAATSSLVDWVAVMVVVNVYLLRASVEASSGARVVALDGCRLSAAGVDTAVALQSLGIDERPIVANILADSCSWRLTGGSSFELQRCSMQAESARGSVFNIAMINVASMDFLNGSYLLMAGLNGTVVSGQQGVNVLFEGFRLFVVASSYVNVTGCRLEAQLNFSHPANNESMLSCVDCMNSNVRISANEVTIHGNSAVVLQRSVLQFMEDVSTLRALPVAISRIVSSNYVIIGFSVARVAVVIDECSSLRVGELECHWSGSNGATVLMASRVEVGGGSAFEVVSTKAHVVAAIASAFLSWGGFLHLHGFGSRMVIASVTVSAFEIDAAAHSPLDTVQRTAVSFVNSVLNITDGAVLSLVDVNVTAISTNNRTVVNAVMIVASSIALHGEGSSFTVDQWHCRISGAFAITGVLVTSSVVSLDSGGMMSLSNRSDWDVTANSTSLSSVQGSCLNLDGTKIRVNRNSRLTLLQESRAKLRCSTRAAQCFNVIGYNVTLMLDVASTVVLADESVLLVTSSSNLVGNLLLINVSLVVQNYSILMLRNSTLQSAASIQTTQLIAVYWTESSLTVADCSTWLTEESHFVVKYGEGESPTAAGRRTSSDAILIMGLFVFNCTVNIMQSATWATRSSRFEATLRSVPDLATTVIARSFAVSQSALTVDWGSSWRISDMQLLSYAVPCVIGPAAVLAMLYANGITIEHAAVIVNAASTLHFTNLTLSVNVSAASLPNATTTVATGLFFGTSAAMNVSNSSVFRFDNTAVDISSDGSDAIGVQWAPTSSLSVVNASQYSMDGLTVSVSASLRAAGFEMVPSRLHVSASSAVLLVNSTVVAVVHDYRGSCTAGPQMSVRGISVNNISSLTVANGSRFAVDGVSLTAAAGRCACNVGGLEVVQSVLTVTNESSATFRNVTIASSLSLLDATCTVSVFAADLMASFLYVLNHSNVSWLQSQWNATLRGAAPVPTEALTMGFSVWRSTVSIAWGAAVSLENITMHIEGVPAQPDNGAYFGPTVDKLYGILWFFSLITVSHGAALVLCNSCLMTLRSSTQATPAVPVLSGTEGTSLLYGLRWYLSDTDVRHFSSVIVRATTFYLQDVNEDFLGNAATASRGRYLYGVIAESSFITVSDGGIWSVEWSNVTADSSRGLVSMYGLSVVSCTVTVSGNESSFLWVDTAVVLKNPRNVSAGNGVVYGMWWASVLLRVAGVGSQWAVRRCNLTLLADNASAAHGILAAANDVQFSGGASWYLDQVTCVVQVMQPDTDVNLCVAPGSSNGGDAAVSGVTVTDFYGTVALLGGSTFAIRQLRFTVNASRCKANTAAMRFIRSRLLFNGNSSRFVLSDAVVALWATPLTATRVLHFIDAPVTVSDGGGVEWRDMTVNINGGSAVQGALACFTASSGVVATVALSNGSSWTVDGATLLWRRPRTAAVTPVSSSSWIAWDYVPLTISSSAFVLGNITATMDDASPQWWRVSFACFNFGAGQRPLTLYGPAASPSALRITRVSLQAVVSSIPSLPPTLLLLLSASALIPDPFAQCEACRIEADCSVRLQRVRVEPRNLDLFLSNVSATYVAGQAGCSTPTHTHTTSALQTRSVPLTVTPGTQTRSMYTAATLTRMRSSNSDAVTPTALLTDSGFTDRGTETAVLSLSRSPTMCKASSSLSNAGLTRTISAELSSTPSPSAAPTATLTTTQSAHMRTIWQRRIAPASTALQLSTLATLPTMLAGSVASIQRLSLISRLGCSEDDALNDLVDLLTSPLPLTDSPLQLLIGYEVGAPHRGAVVGNVIALWGGMGALSGLVVATVRAVWMWHFKKRRLQFAAVAARLQLPAVLVLLVGLLLQQIVMSSVLLVNYAAGAVSGFLDTVGLASHDPTGDAALGVFGVFVAGAVMLAIAAMVVKPAASFAAVAVQRRRMRKPTATRGAVVAERLRWWIEEPLEWKSRAVGYGGPRLVDRIQRALLVGDPRHFTRHYGTLFVAYRSGRHWWLVVELAVTCAVAVNGGIAPLTPRQCTVQAWLTVGIVSLLLVAFMWLRPTQQPLETAATAVVYVAQVVVAMCVAVGSSGVFITVISTVTAVLLSVVAAILSAVKWSRIFLSQCSGVSVNRSVGIGDEHHQTRGHFTKRATGTESVLLSSGQFPTDVESYQLMFRATPESRLNWMIAYICRENTKTNRA